MKLTVVESIDLLFGKNEFSPLNDIVDGFVLIDDSIKVREIFDRTKSTLNNEIFMI